MIKALLTLLSFLVLSLSAQAQLTGTDIKPGDSCTASEEGYVARNASADRDISEITLICDGTTWQSATGGDLPALSSASIWVGNASNAATAVTMSGDATLSNAGVLTISSNAIGSAEITDGTIANADLAGAITLSKLAITGTGSTSNYLRGDGSWQAVPSGADNLGDHIATTVLRSDTHNTDDLGTTAIRWKDGWFQGTVTAGTFAGSGASLTALNATNLASGTVAAARMPALTGDVTMTAGTTATTIADEAVTAAKTDFVGTLTEGKWCTVSSGKIVCTSDAPSGGGGGATFQSFTAPGTTIWNKPASGTIAYVECWGGGGSGARQSTAAAKKGGGGGGGYNNGWFPLAALPASVTVTVGAGGAAVSSNTDGIVGGNSSFGTYLVGYGGGGGGATSKGGGGGGQLSAGSTPTPGRPLIVTNVFNDTFLYVGNGSACISNGWSGCTDFAPSEGVHHGGGGGGGSTAAMLAGGSSAYGGGGGGGRVSSTNGVGGTSLAGGAGGAGGTPGIGGQQPGGGGGGSSTTSGKGGDGQCNVTVF